MWLLVVCALLVASSPVRAVDVPIAGLKLIVVDKIAAADKAKAVFVAKDGAIAKGAGTDASTITATLDVAYDGVRGSFVMPEGAGWLVNSATVAKYVNREAPEGGAVKVGVLKPGSLAKVVAKSLGDAPLDVSSVPSGAVYVAETIVNGGEETRLCTQFSACTHKTIAQGTGFKLVCKGSSGGDPACTAATPSSTTTTSVPASTTSTTVASTTTSSTTLASTTSTSVTTTTSTSTTTTSTPETTTSTTVTTTTSTSTTTSSTVATTTTTTTLASTTTTSTSLPPSTTTSSTTTTVTTTTTTTTLCVATDGTFCDLGDGTVFDAATGLQWEKKNGAGGGPNAANPQDVDNRYAWAGTCSVATSVQCQPDATASASCTVHTGGATGCAVCAPADGSCTMPTGAVTTIWSWVEQLNAAALAGHDDWRVPTSDGSPLQPTGQPAEIESILDPSLGLCAGGTGPCISAIFGPVAGPQFWSASTRTGIPASAWALSFTTNVLSSPSKASASFVRAVRSAGP